MNTTPEQLRLAADILENNLPWESRYSTGPWSEIGTENGPFQTLVNGRELRLKPISFPPLPEGMTYHNPDGLTAEQVGDGWRLLTTEELDGKSYSHSFYWSRGLEKWFQCGTEGNYYCRHTPSNTLRVPISTPFPDGSRIVDGKLVKPWTLTRHIPGFRPLRDGEEWMTNEDWKEEMFHPVCQKPARPLMKGEKYDPDICCTHDHRHITTCRPLPEPPKLVPLGPSDAPPGSVFRYASWEDGAYWTPTVVNSRGPSFFNLHHPEHPTWESLMNNKEWQILRPGQTDWQPCSKTA